MPYNNELYHYGVKGQKWHQRRYQNYDGSLTPAGKARYSSGSTITENIITENVITENVEVEEMLNESDRLLTEERLEEVMTTSMENAVKLAKDPKVRKLVAKTLKVAIKTPLKKLWTGVKKKAKAIKNKISGWLSKHNFK
jgi:hypothetical protein